MDIELKTNEELIDELMSRSTFKGIIVCGKGDYDNQNEGDGGVRIRIAKGIRLLDLMTYLEVTMSKIKKMFPRAFIDYFGERWSD